jgi:hypothetical protein
MQRAVKIFQRQKKKGVAGDVSISLGFNSHPRLSSIHPYTLDKPIDSLSFSEQLDVAHVADVFVACFYQFCCVFDVRCGFACIIVVLEGYELS